MTVKEKDDESLKRRFCADGQGQQGTIKATEGMDIAVVDLPGAYLSADMDDKEEVLMVL